MRPSRPMAAASDWEGRRAYRRAGRVVGEVVNARDLDLEVRVVHEHAAKDGGEAVAVPGEKLPEPWNWVILTCVAVIGSTCGYGAPGVPRLHRDAITCNGCGLTTGKVIVGTDRRPCRQARVAAYDPSQTFAV